MRRTIDDESPGLTNACGCYVFAVRAAKGYRPIYIGQTKKAKLFDEAFVDRNVNLLNNELTNGMKKGNLTLFLLPVMTPGGKYGKQDSAPRTIDFVEQWLIGEAFRKNAELINVQHTAFLNNLHIVGVFNAKKGESNSASRELRKAIIKK